jgi:hypothetical protein
MSAGSVHPVGRRDTASIGAVRRARFAVSDRKYGVGSAHSKTIVCASGTRTPSASGECARSAPRAVTIGRAARSSARSSAGVPARPGACFAATRRTRSTAPAFGSPSSSASGTQP